MSVAQLALPLEPVVLEGSLIRLEPLMLDHLAALAPVALDPELWRFTTNNVTDRDTVEMARFFQQTMFGMMLLWGLHPPSPLRPLLENTFEQYWTAVRLPAE